MAAIEYASLNGKGPNVLGDSEFLHADDWLWIQPAP
jgi:hypothetical protein